MANYYVRSTDGSNTDGGTSWALADAGIATSVSREALGDTIYVSQVHSEIVAGVVNIQMAGTAAAPNRLLCANDGAEPPTALATTGVIGTSGASNILLTGNFYTYGLTLNAGDAANVADIGHVASNGVAEVQIAEACQFVLTNTAAASKILIGHLTSSFPHKSTWKNCHVKFANVAQRIMVSGSEFNWKGGGALAGTTTPTSGLLLNAGTGRSGVVLIEGVDLSNFGPELALVGAASMPGRIVYRNCKLPAAWAGALFNATPTLAGVRAEMYNCHSGDTNYRLHIEDCAGSIKSETAVVRTGGASDGSTPLSWRMASTANCSFVNPMESGEIVKWNDAIGTQQVATVEVITDGVTLTDGEAWLEVQVLGTSGFPISSFVTDAKATTLAAASPQAASTDAWTTTGLSTPVKQKLSVAFTAQEKGWVSAKIVVAKASAVVFADPVLSVA